MRQVMLQLGEGDVLSFAHLPARLQNQGTLFGGEDVVGVQDALEFYEHAVPFWRKGHEIALAHTEFFENFAWNDDLAPLADAPDVFRSAILLAILSDYLTFRNNHPPQRPAKARGGSAMD